MGKDPRPLNNHLNKIFSGIHTLDHEPMPKNSNTKYYIKSIVAINQEEVVELDVGTDQRKLEVDQSCEEWLRELIVRMREALQRLFRVVYTDNNQARRIKEHSYMRNWIGTQKG